jgi:hypothetical protein
VESTLISTAGDKLTKSVGGVSIRLGLVRRYFRNPAKAVTSGSYATNH